mmetsp:Transcript_16052/g.36825  ORF Transcript_16052/g.36825 Transcript_16052/m.36825 type:complete len:231 (+) Transcript_16052:693-1385(+)
MSRACSAMICCCCTMACWCSMICLCTSCCCCIVSKNTFFSLCSSTFCRASRKLGRISSFSFRPSRIASPFAKATCMGPSSRISGMSTHCSCNASIDFSASSSLSILTNAQPTPLWACDAITKTSNTSPNSSKHSRNCCCVTSLGNRPTKSLTPPFSFSIQGRLSGIDGLLDFRRRGGERRCSRLTRRRRCDGLGGAGLSWPLLPIGAPYRDGERLRKPGEHDLLRAGEAS